MTNSSIYYTSSTHIYIHIYILLEATRSTEVHHAGAIYIPDNYFLKKIQVLLNDNIIINISCYRSSLATYINADYDGDPPSSSPST